MRGGLRHLIKGVYVVAAVPDSTGLRCAALSLVVPDDCVVVDRHAGWLLGAHMVLAPNEHLEMRPISMFRPSGRGRLRNDLSVSGERNLLPSDIVEVHGVPVTTAIRTAWDLGRVRWPSQAITGLDSMLGLGHFTHDELLAGVERFKGMRFVTTLRGVAPLADGSSQSPGESVLRLRWIEGGLPTPRPQLPVWDGDSLLGILDIGNEEIGYAAEYDGAEWHSSAEQVDHDRARRRDIQDAGWTIDVFTSADVFGQGIDPEARLRLGAATARQRLPRRAS